MSKWRVISKYLLRSDGYDIAKPVYEKFKTVMIYKQKLNKLY
jgi:hypothetical protein